MTLEIMRNVHSLTKCLHKINDINHYKAQRGKMNLPSKIKVACFDVKVEEFNPGAPASRMLHGEFSSIEMMIRIDTSTDKIKVVDTLMHEICHAICWAYGIEDEDKEERVVGTMATGLTQVYRDNPELLTFMQDKLHWQGTHNDV